MASVHIFVLSVLSFLVLSRCMGEMRNFKCPPPFNCGKLGQISPPFSNRSNSRCGLVLVGDCDQPVQKIQFQRGSSGKWYEVRNISQANTMNILDKELNRQLQIRDCRVFNNLSLPSHSFYAFKIETNITLFRCNRCSNCSPPLTDFNYTKCNHDVHYNRPNKSMPSCPPHCSTIQLPLNKTVVVNDDPFKFIDSQFLLGLHVWPPCLECIFEGGYCQDDKEGRFQCAGKSPKGNGKRRSVKVGIAVGVSVIGLLIICSIFVGFWYCNRRKFGPTNFLSVRTSSNPSSKSSLERDNAFFGVPVFKYDDLQKATNYFDEANELGDGGYGTVYHGQLQDGREVAVKRLYDNNYKRVEQFVNEIKILTLLRHKNLVTLYGCTSRRSQELLLVYEFISNGTVADHLHCERPSSLTWPVRLRIAIETASALAYLHASDIIHRDVKTSNILLDNNFSVKVADFGLSRLFPNDVTHISTAPQGTPGYVDPEYHQCYQLTEKSDVYSFGVVLIELISSLPAVDISRDRDEINLSNLAVNRIQNKAFHHLVDPCLGFESDCGVRRMTILVAELACQCLQLDREERPSMDDVLGALRRIYDEGYGREKTEQADNIGAMTSCVARPPASPESEDGVLLKRLHLLTSPTSVTDKWVSQSTTPNISV